MKKVAPGAAGLGPVVDFPVDVLRDVLFRREIAFLGEFHRGRGLLPRGLFRPGDFPGYPSPFKRHPALFNPLLLPRLEYGLLFLLLFGQFSQPPVIMGFFRLEAFQSRGGLYIEKFFSGNLTIFRKGLALQFNFGRFFLQVNYQSSHRDRFGEYAMDPDFPVDPERVRVPAYMALPDWPEIREDLARYYSQNLRMDRMLGEVLRALDELGEVPEPIREAMQRVRLQLDAADQLATGLKDWDSVEEALVPAAWMLGQQVLLDEGPAAAYPWMALAVTAGPFTTGSMGIPTAR